MASTTSFDRKGLRLGMESSPASAEVKGSTQAEEKERDRKKRVERKRWASESDNNERRRACRTGHPRPENRWSEVAARLPAHAVAAGSPVEPACMEAWNDDCRSKRSLCIFTALRRERGRV